MVDMRLQPQRARRDKERTLRNYEFRMENGVIASSPAEGNERSNLPLPEKTIRKSEMVDRFAGNSPVEYLAMANIKFAIGVCPEANLQRATREWE